MALGLAAVVAVMVGLSFAAVPALPHFLPETGWAGTPQRAASAPNTIAPETVTVRFDANVTPGLPWSFEPVQPELTLHVGENKLAFFRAVNRSKETVTGSAVFNVSPDIMGQYFTKVQCFCFTEQTLKPGEAVEMPVSFFIDPAILKDRDAKTVRDMTLSYTFYKVQKPQRASRRCSGNSKSGLKPFGENHGSGTRQASRLPSRRSSPWPIVGSISALVLAIGAIIWMKSSGDGVFGVKGPWVFAAGAAGVLLTMFLWWRDVIIEGVYKGDHTPVVQLSLRYGMMLFIASEVMFFFAWFWAYFNVSLFPPMFTRSRMACRLASSAATRCSAANGRPCRPRTAPSSTPSTLGSFRSSTRSCFSHRRRPSPGRTIRS